MATDKSKTGVTAATSTIHDYSEVPLSEDSITPNNKNGTTTTTTAVPGEDENLIANETGVSKPDRDLKAAIWTIVCGVALPCIPIIAVSIALLAMILTKRQKIEPGWPELMLPVAKDDDTSAAHNLWKLRHLGGPWAYYTDRNPTTITTVASWTSRVLPYLTSSIMALVAFFAARRIATKSRCGGGDDLPTPTEVTLLINLLSGKDFGPLKDTLLHRWAYKKKLADPIPLAFTALSLITFVGILIPIVDTWFGISTTPQTIVIIANTSDDRMSFNFFPSYHLSETLCPNGPGGFTAANGLEWIPCNLVPDNSGNDTLIGDPVFQLVGTGAATRVASGLSNMTAIYETFDPDPNVDAEYTFLIPPVLNFNFDLLDYKAQTYGIDAQCELITDKCLPGVTWPWYNGDAHNFTCSPGFSANFTFPGAAQTIDATLEDGGVDTTGQEPVVGLSFASDADLSRRVGAYNPSLFDTTTASVPSLAGSNLSYEYVLPRNPLYFGAWASGFPSFGDEQLNKTLAVSEPLLNDTEIYRSSFETSLWVLNCSATVYELNYTYVNGSIISFQSRLTSPEMAALFSAPFAVDGIRPAYVELFKVAAAASAQEDGAHLATSFAGGWAQAALAMSMGVLEGGDPIINQTRTSYGPVARVPLVPLYLLLSLKALYVVAVIILAIGAYCFTHPAETELIKEQLSAKGLAAAHFDDPGILQKNATNKLEERLMPTPTTTGLDEKMRTKVVESEKQAEEPKPGVTKTVTGLDEMTEKRVGLVARADGAWRFAVIANGMWNGIKPIAVDLIGIESKKGNLGEVGDLITAWK